MSTFICPTSNTWRTLPIVMATVFANTTIPTYDTYDSFILTKQAISIPYTYGILYLSADNSNIEVDELSENIKILDKIAALSSDWDGYGANPFDKQHVELVKNILRSLPKQPSIFPTANDSIQLEYENADGSYLEFEIFNTGDINKLLCTSEEEYTTGRISQDEIYESVKEFFAVRV